MQPSYNSFSYQQPVANAFQPSPVVHHKAVTTTDKSIFTPFLNTNKLPGDFVPIFKSKNLPYKIYNDIR